MSIFNWRKAAKQAELDLAMVRTKRVSAQVTDAVLAAGGCLNPVGAALDAQIAQLKFLLASAPMIDAPSDRSRMSASTSPFAYVHPKTMAQMLRDMRLQGSGRSFRVFPGSPTKWVMLSTMPEGRVIYSPLPVPGLEKILAQ